MIPMEKLGVKLQEFDPTMSESTKDMFNLMMDMYVDNFNDIQRQLDHALGRIRSLESRLGRMGGHSRE